MTTLADASIIANTLAGIASLIANGHPAPSIIGNLNCRYTPVQLQMRKPEDVDVWATHTPPTLIPGVLGADGDPWRSYRGQAAVNNPGLGAPAIIDVWAARYETGEDDE